jgi:hypothetical protein
MGCDAVIHRSWAVTSALSENSAGTRPSHRMNVHRAARNTLTSASAQHRGEWCECVGWLIYVNTARFQPALVGGR